MFAPLFPGRAGGLAAEISRQRRPTSGTRPHPRPPHEQRARSKDAKALPAQI